jgi:hypothetical protein
VGGTESRPREARFSVIAAKTKVIHAVVCKKYAALDGTRRSPQKHGLNDVWLRRSRFRDIRVLLSVAPKLEEEPMASDSNEVELTRVPGGMNARSIVAALNGRGIPARSQGEAVGEIYGLTLDGLGEVSIYVPKEFLEEAKSILAAAEHGDLVLGDDDVTE